MVDWHLFYVGIICNFFFFFFYEGMHTSSWGSHWLPLTTITTCQESHAAQRKDGGERGHRKYSKRSQKYHAEVVREEKSYNYFPFLISKMLQRRSQIEGSFSQPSDRNEFDPKQIAPTLAMKEPPPTEVLMKGPSRFPKKSKFWGH